MIRLIAFAIALTTCGLAQAETYRLVHAVGNTEKISAKGLSKDECAARKKELAIVAKSIGAPGSITCLPDSFFDS